MIELNVLENHKSSCRALSTIFRGWYAYSVLASGKIVKGVVTFSIDGRVVIGGTVMSEKDPIKYYKTVKIS